MIKKITEWMQIHWKLSLIIAGSLALVFIVFGTIQSRRAEANNVHADPNTPNPGSITGTNNNSEDSILMRKQPELVERYGSLPAGYLWDLDGTLLSQGVKSMSAEEVVYAYINGVRSLDFSMAQKYSRKSKVVDTYSDYFNSNVPTSDYSDAFMRNMYKQALMSLQVKGIESTSVFAENKQVFTVRLQMLDLTNKDFWLQDKYSIYNTLQIYSASDSTQAELYLYDYILEYYKSEGAATREVTVDITVEKYVDLDTGWLVSIDGDIDSACQYRNGTPVVRYIREMYAGEGRDYLETYVGPIPEATISPKETPRGDG